MPLSFFFYIMYNSRFFSGLANISSAAQAQVRMVVAMIVVVIRMLFRRMLGVP
jgi:hypothetical protein